MSVFRLLPFSLLIATGVATLAAQSSPEKTPANILPGKTEWLNSSASANPISPDVRAGLNPPSPLDRILVGDYRPHLNQLNVPRSRLQTEIDVQSQDDTLCYSIRNYKVARDGPQSDSTHPAGYATCQPARRFRMHTIDGVILPSQP